MKDDYGIEECLIPYESDGSNGFSEVLKLQVIGKGKVMYRVLHHDPRFYLNEEYQSGLPEGMKISFKKLMKMLHEQYSSFSHLRCKTEESGLVIILVNDDLRS